MKNYPFPISQLDTLARYLINNHGDIVKTDDLSLETAVDEAIKVMEILSSQQVVQPDADRKCLDCVYPSGYVRNHYGAKNSAVQPEDAAGKPCPGFDCKTELRPFTLHVPGCSKCR